MDVTLTGCIAKNPKHGEVQLESEQDESSWILSEFINK